MACTPWISKFKEFPSVGKNNNSNFSLTQNSQFISLLEQARPPLWEGDLSAIDILDLFNLNLAPTHLISENGKEEKGFWMRGEKKGVGEGGREGSIYNPTNGTETASFCMVYSCMRCMTLSLISVSLATLSSHFAFIGHLRGSHFPLFRFSYSYLCSRMGLYSCIYPVKIVQICLGLVKYFWQG